MKRAGGDCLVLRTGEPPHVLTGSGRQDVAKAILSANALEALVTQIFSEEGKNSLALSGHVTQSVNVPEASLTVLARAERHDGRVTIELRPEAPAAPAAPEPPPQLQWMVAPPSTALEPVAEGPPAIDAASMTPAAGDEGPIFDFATAPPLPADEIAQPIQEPAPLEQAPALSFSSADLSVFQQESNPLPTPLAAEEPLHQGPTWTIREPEPEPLVAASVEFVARTHEEPVVTQSHLHSVEPPAASSTRRESLPSGVANWAARAASRGATAVYLRAGSQPLARVDERLEPLVGGVIEGWLFDELLDEVKGGLGRGWEPGSSGEWVRHEEGLGLVSCWPFSDDQGPGLMIRLRPQKSTKSFHKLIPRKVRAACDGDGLIVVSASTAADVSAMAAAVADIAGQRRGGYVISLRPAGAQRHEIGGAFVSQREFGGSEGDIAAAIRSAANESPDVLVVAPPASEGALREVVNATDAGRLVILAVLAPSSMHALRAIAGRAAAGDAQTRLALATSFRAAFTSRVMQRLGGGRTLVRDLIVGTSEVSALLASGDFAGIARVQREGAMGMTTVDGALARAVRRGHLSLRQAAGQATDRRLLVSMVRAARRQDPKAARGGEQGGAEVFESVGSTRRSAAEPRRWSAY